MNRILQRSKSAESAIFFLCIALYFTTSSVLAEHYYFAFSSLIFDSDSERFLANFTVGPSSPTQISPAVFAFSTLLLSPIDYISTSEFTHQSKLFTTLSIFSAIGAFKSVLFYKILVLLQLRKRHSLLYTIVFSISSSNFFFSVTPDTYGLSGFLITAMIFVFVKYQALDFPKFQKLLILGISSVGVLLTNLIPFFLTVMALTLSLWKKGQSVILNFRTPALLLSTTIGLVIVIHGSAYYTPARSMVLSGPGETEEFKASFSCLSASEFSSYFANRPTDETPYWWKSLPTSNPVYSLLSKAGSNNHVTKWLLKFDPVPRMLAMGLAFTDSVFMPSDNSSTKAIEYCENIETLSISSVDTENRSIFSLAISTLIAFIVFVGIIYLWKFKKFYLLASLCLSILLYNFSFHLIWGGPDLFLYSQHWITPIFILFIAGLEKLLPQKMGIKSGIICSVIFLQIYMNSLHFLQLV